MRRIALLVPLELTDLWPAGAGVMSCLGLNPKQANVMGVCVDHMRMSVAVLLTHPEFPECPAGAEPPCYDATQARAKFPYLFADTDPLLYRGFDGLRARLAMTRSPDWASGGGFDPGRRYRR
jgi:hypothetical protein